MTGNETDNYVISNETYLTIVIDFVNAIYYVVLENDCLSEADLVALVVYDLQKNLLYFKLLHNV